MKVELENAYINMSVDTTLCRIPAEKAVIYMNEDGSVFQFEAKIMLGTPIDSILRIGNKTRMRVSFNGLADQYSFIYSEPNQVIKITGVDFMSNDSTERV